MSKEIQVPNIGDFADVEVIEILVNAGDTVAAEDSLISVESDKATMEIPAPEAGVIKDVKVAVGDKVSEGSVILLLDPATESAAEAPPAVKPETPVAANEAPAPAASTPAPEAPAPAAGRTAPQVAAASVRQSPTARIDEVAFSKAYASPAVRRFARELGVDLGLVAGTGPKGRIIKQDVKVYVKQALTQGVAGGGLAVAPMPEIDFSSWGEIETRPLTKINKLTGEFLHRNWVTVPHVTQFDEADITEMESFRKAMAAEYKEKGKMVKVTPLVFIMKAVVQALKEYPRFNSSLDSSGSNLILKKYFNIGIAVDTPEGLVVPVVRDVDMKSLEELAVELGEISIRAREKKIRPDEMKGGCISISSLGGIGGTKFTPIVNAPEVAVLGISRHRMQPVWNGKEFEPRLILPLSLSYDHRVIDGADGARFTTFLCQVLADTRRLLL